MLKGFVEDWFWSEEEEDSRVIRAINPPMRQRANEQAEAGTASKLISKFCPNYAIRALHGSGESRKRCSNPC